jgi:hypothetical protein
MAIIKKLKTKRKGTRKDIILVTGQSGIKVEECLKKIANTHQILKVERQMIEVLRDEERTSLINADDKEIMTAILASPPLKQKYVWDKAFKVIQSRLKRAKRRANKEIFITFHACFYHQRKTELISPINFSKLLGLRKRVKMVIVLVDDCYDIYKRLLAKDEMFYEDVRIPNIKPEEAMVKSVWNLLTILFWREVEIGFSRKIAETLKVPFFVVAVKHPASMIRKLTSEPLEKLKIFYLAHSITSVRKKTYARSSQFPEDLNNSVKYVLEKMKNAILFLPDTIDELRIKEGNGEKYLPDFHIGGGWPLPFKEEEWLFVSLPEEVKSITNPLNPKGFNYLATPKLASHISYAIGVLAKKINEQITSRDFSLIEQSKDGMIAFQPYLDGGISGGALDEAKYNFTLRTQIGSQDRELYVIERKENLGKRHIEHFFIQLIVNIKAEHNDLSEDEKRKIHELKEKWKQNPNKVIQFYKRSWLVEKTKEEIKKHLPAGYVFSDKYIPVQKKSLPGAKMYEKQDRLKLGWEKLSKEAKAYDDEFRCYCVNPARNYLICASDITQSNLKKLINVLSFRQQKRRRK